MIRTFIRQFTYKTILNKKDVVMLQDKYYLVNGPMKNIWEHMQKTYKEDPFSIGLYLGKQKGHTFFPSLALLELIMPHAESIVTVNDEVAFLFICGRDIFTKGIVELHGKCAENTLVFVQNKNKEMLGFGKRVHPITSRKEVVTNIYDIGDFLRREMKR